MKRMSLLLLAVLLLAFVQAVSAGVVPTETEYFFTEIKASTGPRRVVPITITNTSASAITINSASFIGTNASEFSFSTAPTLPLNLAANASVTYNVVFYPPDGTTYTPPYPPSAFRTASLQVSSTDSTTPTLNVPLYGLSTNGTGGNNEPRLQMVTDILGFSTNVGTTAYLVRPLPEDFTPIGDEVVAQLFEKAGPGNVTMTAVMRWSPTGVINYGYYFPDGTLAPTLHEVNRISTANAIGNSLNHQTLMPATATTNRTFDPGTQRFGIYDVSPAFPSYTQDHLNGRTDQRIRAARTFLVRQRNGSSRPDTYLVVFEDSTNGDFQDFGFLLTNVRPISDMSPTLTTANVVPANNATNVSGNINITLPFSEAVTATGSAFTLTCGTAQPFTLIGSGTSTLTLDPISNLPSESSCMVTGAATGITDSGGNFLTNSFSFTFTVADMIAPTVITASVAPANNANNVTGNTNITIPFSEAVTAAGSAFTLTCGTSQPFTLTGSGTSTLTLDPTNTLASGAACMVVGTAADITDAAGNTLASNINLSFTIADTVTPTVITANVVPFNNATGVAGNTNIILPFSEAVTAAGSAFMLTCGISQPFALTGSGTSTLTLNPTSSLPSGAACIVIGTATGITDLAGNELASDFSLDFTVADTVAPTVITANVVPSNNATGIAGSTNITLPFSEAVTVAGSAFTLTCGTSQPFALTGSGTSTLTLNPTSNLPSGAACTVVSAAAGITDTAGNPLASNISLNFTIADTVAPTVITANVVPANNANNVAGNTNITIPFSEAVAATGSAFTLTCGTAQPFTLTGSGTSTLTLNPTSNLPSGSACTVVGTAANIMDAAGNALAGDVSFNFTIADTVAPTVITANVVPSNNATGVAGSTNITIPFSEAVMATGSAFTLTCGTAQSFALTGSGTNILTLDPTNTLSSSALCTVVVGGSGVFDTAGNPMVSNVTLNFTVADTVPPTVVLTTPIPGTGTPVSSNIVLTFNEPVDLGATPVTLACPTPTMISFVTTPVLPATNVTLLTLNPTGNLPYSATCTVAVVAAQVADDAGNQLSGTTVFTFTTVINPALLNQTVTLNVFSSPTPTLTWSILSWATSYDVEIDTDLAFAEPRPTGYTTALNVNTNSLTLPTALPAGTYYFRVRGKSGVGGLGRFGSAESFTIING